MQTPTLAHECCPNAFQAVRTGHVQCLTRMTKAQFLERDINGQTPLHVAAKLGRLQALQIIMAEAPDAQDVISRCGENAVLVAAAEGQMKCLQVLLKDNVKEALPRAQQRDINGTTVLMAVVARGDNDLAFWLLSKFGKSLLLLPNNYRMLPLHVAAAQGNIDFIRTATKYDHRMVNYRDQYGCTPAFYAVQGGCLICTRYLIEKAGADICVVSDKGQSLLQIACLAGHAHIVRWIIQRSSPATLLWTTKDDASAVHCAAYSGSVAALGILFRVIPHKRRRQVLALRDSRGNTPLHLTAINNHTDAAQFLLENGAEPRLLNNAGQTADAIARIRKNFQLVKLLQYWKEKRQGKGKRSPTPTAEPYVDNAYSSGYWSIASQTLPNSSSQVVPVNQIRAPSSQYYNGINNYSSHENFANSTIYGGTKSTELRPLTYIASDEGGRIYEDLSVQTDRDSLRTATKVLDVDEWRESLAAVAQIDRVLQEIDT